MCSGQPCLTEIMASTAFCVSPPHGWQMEQGQLRPPDPQNASTRTARNYWTGKCTELVSDRTPRMQIYLVTSFINSSVMILPWWIKIRIIKKYLMSWRNGLGPSCKRLYTHLYKRSVVWTALYSWLTPALSTIYRGTSSLAAHILLLELRVIWKNT